VRAPAAGRFDGDADVNHPALDDDVATLLDLDPWSIQHARPLLAGLCCADRAAVDQICREIVARIGSFAHRTPLASSSDAVLLAAYLEAAPAVADWMTRRGVPATTIAATLGDLGRHLRLHRAHTGGFGLDAAWWLAEVLSGTLFQLGRLQFQLRRLRPAEPQPPAATGLWWLDVHIPEAGPLTPGAVDASFDRAAAFFAHYFPDSPARTAICNSWLLDQYLAEHLAPTSNIVTFGRSFTPYGEPVDDDLDAVYFTFGVRSLDGMDRLPRQSSLQRLVLDRIESGGRWTRVLGYRPLPGAAILSRTASAP
jgi:GNAT-like C-terminal domain/N-acyltransferase N-terminal domain